MPTQSSQQTSQGWKYLGFNYASWWNGKFANRQSTQALTQMAEIGADTTTIVPTSYMDNTRSSRIYATQKTESLANVEKAIVDSHNLGLQVWLKPHIDTAGSEWRGAIDPANRQQFFQNYEEYLLDYARLAQKHNVEALVIGTELNGLMKSSDRRYWLDVIESVREVYDGQLTYAANWDTANQIPFVDALDFIGVDAYYPLTENRNASVNDLVQAWTGTPQDSYTRRLTGDDSIVDWLRGLSEAADKPIVFTEIGFRSLDGNAARSYDYARQGAVDREEPVRLYEAFFQVFGDEPWFDGAQLWSWHATGSQNNVPNNPSDTSYAILNKPAEQVFRRYANELLSEGNPVVSPATPTPTPLVTPEPPPEPTPPPAVPPSPEPPSTPEPGDELVDDSSVEIDFVVTADWNNGFSGDVKITNTGDTPIQNWTVEFETNYDLAKKWNATVSPLDNSRYRARAKDTTAWNATIAPGQTISFGFVGKAAIPSAPTNYKVTGDGLVGTPTMPVEMPTPPPITPPPAPPPTTPAPPSPPINDDVPLSLRSRLTGTMVLAAIFSSPTRVTRRLMIGR